MRGIGAAAVVLGALLVAPASAWSADPPPGAAMSSNLEYLTRIAGANGITEGKFDKVRGKDVLVITGRFGFKTYDVEDPEKPKLLDEFIPADLAAGGYWQNEDMELDTKRKLIIGALDPRHTDSATIASPCPPGGSTANPNCKSGFYVISYENPANMRQIGDFVDLPSGHTSSCIQNCKYIWTGGPARRSDQLRLGPILSPTAPAPYTFTRLVGDGRPIWVTDLTNPAPARGLRPAGRHLAQRRLHGLLARRRRGRRGHRVGQRSRRHPRLRHRRLRIATRTRTATARPRRSSRSWSPAAASPARRSP